jgi:hypothetical protein
MLFIFKIYMLVMSFKKILCGFQDSEVRSLAFVRTSLLTVRTLISQATSIRTTWFFVQTPISVQKLRTIQGCIRSDVPTTRLDVIQCSTSKRISFANTDMERQLQPSGRQVYTVRTLSLIRQDVEQLCNRPSVRFTSSGRQSLLWKLRTAKVQLSKS